jgi:hypothetical protein
MAVPIPHKKYAVFPVRVFSDINDTSFEMFGVFSMDVVPPQLTGFLFHSLESAGSYCDALNDYDSRLGAIAPEPNDDVFAGDGAPDTHPTSGLALFRVVLSFPRIPISEKFAIFLEGGKKAKLVSELVNDRPLALNMLADLTAARAGGPSPSARRKRPG